MGNRFWNHVVVRRPHECWLWVGPTTLDDIPLHVRVEPEVGTFTLHARRHLAWLLTGTVPRTTPEPECGNDLCVNPGHTAELAGIETLPQLVNS